VKDASSISSNIESDDSFSISGKKRKRKNSDQISILLKHFKRNPKWDKETVENAARESGLSRSQAYKWGWDRRKKSIGKEGFCGPSKDEFGGYSKHNFTDTITPITNILGIDMKTELMKLDLSPDSKDIHLKHKEECRGSSQNEDFSPIKKRAKKLREKKIENSSVGQEITQNKPQPARMMKDEQVQTPKQAMLNKEAYLTPVKTARLLDLDNITVSPKVKQSLFSRNSENLQDSSLKTERKQISSENSLK